MKLNWSCSVNCEAELIVMFDKRDPKSAASPCKGAETDSWAKLGKETVAGAHRRPKWAPHYGARLAQGVCSGCSGHGSGRLRLCSGSAQVCSPSAQVKAAVPHVRRLKRNQRKRK
jgi:hypothetical protein